MDFSIIIKWFYSEPLRCGQSVCSGDHQCYGSTDLFGFVYGQDCSGGVCFGLLGCTPDRCQGWLGQAPCDCYCKCVVVICNHKCGVKC